MFQDPDGCIDMRHFPIINAGTPYEDCSGPDESFIEFTTERFDNFDVADAHTGNFQVRDSLVDDAFAPGALLNKPYLRNTAGSIVAVPRPQTGGDLKDGFGYGPDDDLPGLVIMANIGAARAFDENFDAVPGGVIRNMGGFINSVSQELLTKRGGSAITAWMQMIAGMVEPIALVDLDVDAAGVDYLRRLESGPVQAFQFIAPPQNDDDILFEISSSYSPFELELRVVLVEGVAPTFIHDKNHDGRFTADRPAQDGIQDPVERSAAAAHPGLRRGRDSDGHGPHLSAAVVDLSRPGWQRAGRRNHLRRFGRRDSHTPETAIARSGLAGSPVRRDDSFGARTIAMARIGVAPALQEVARTRRCRGFLAQRRQDFRFQQQGPRAVRLEIEPDVARIPLRRGRTGEFERLGVPSGRETSACASPSL